MHEHLPAPRTGWEQRDLEAFRTVLTIRQTQQCTNWAVITREHISVPLIIDNRAVPDHAIRVANQLWVTAARGTDGVRLQSK